MAEPSTCSTMTSLPSGETMIRSAVKAPCETPASCWWSAASAGVSCRINSIAYVGPRASWRISESRRPGIWLETSARPSPASSHLTARTRPIDGWLSRLSC